MIEKVFERDDASHETCNLHYQAFAKCTFKARNLEISRTFSDVQFRKIAQMHDGGIGCLWPVTFALQKFKLNLQSCFGQTFCKAELQALGFILE